MAKEKKTTETKTDGVRKFTIEKESTKKVAACKVALPLIRVGGSGEKIGELIEQAVAETGATHIRGTLTLYVS